MPIKKDKFLCMSMAGKNYGDSIKSLSDYIKANHPNAQVVWAFTDTFFDKVECDETKVRLYTFKYYYHALTCKYFLVNQHCRSIMFHKRSGQVKLQTWHGTALKRLGADSKKYDTTGIIKYITPDANKYELRDTDVFAAGSEFMMAVYKSAYNWRNTYLTGTPRNDIFFHDNESIRQKVRSYYGINQQKIILYAPTFRVGDNLVYYDVDLEKIKNYFERKDGYEYVILVRLHPNIMYKMEEFTRVHSINFINATLYPDIQELLYTADVLITDYSSVMFDFMYSYKPIILYVSDKDSYNRGFYFDIDKLPFAIVNNNNELVKVLESFDWDSYHHGIDAFLKEIGSAEDGRATERVYKMITTYINKMDSL